MLVGQQETENHTEQRLSLIHILFPALAPAASAGLRFPRDVRASIRTSLRVRAVLRLMAEGLPVVFATFAWPLCLLHVGVEDFPFLVPAPFPLERCEVPFDRAEPARFFEEELSLIHIYSFRRFDGPGEPKYVRFQRLTSACL